MRRPSALRLSVVLLAVGLVAACGGEEPEEAPTSGSPDSSEVPTVTGGFGEAPEIELPDGSPGSELVSEVLDAGDGATVADGQLIVANYQALLWPAEAASEEASEPLFDTFETDSPEPFPMTEGRALPGMIKGLVDAKVGSRVLLVLPPEEGFGADGRTDMGIGPDDSLVFVFDILDSFDPDQAAEGTPVDPDPVLPVVADGDDGPTATMPSSAPPTELVSQVLIQGDGAEVEAGQLLVVQYRGQLWKDGSEFDSSWGGDAATAFPIGEGSVIPGWDKTLVGQAVGTRVLLVIPPAEGYGEAGKPPAIAADDTLVFVVDILGAYGAAAEAAPPATTSAPTETPAG